MTEPLDGSIGPHLVRFEPPDLILLVLRGDFTAEQVNDYLDTVRRISAQHGQMYALCAVDKLGTLTSDARQRLVRSGFPYQALGVIGASFAARVLITTIITAGRRLAPRFFQYPIRFCADEAEARAWLDLLRQQAVPVA